MTNVIALAMKKRANTNDVRSKVKIIIKIELTDNERKAYAIFY